MKNEPAARFAVKTAFANPIYAVEETERFTRVNEQITDGIGHSHRSYAEIAYDALHIAVQSSLDVRGSDLQTLRESLVSNANSYDGITGEMSLNDAGDRLNGSYDFWSVVSDRHRIEYVWDRVAPQ